MRPTISLMRAGDAPMVFQCFQYRKALLIERSGGLKVILEVRRIAQVEEREGDALLVPQLSLHRQGLLKCGQSLLHVVNACVETSQW